MIEYNIVRKARLKHTYIRIKEDATVEIRTNLTTSIKKIESLVEQKSRWIREKQEFIQNKMAFDDDKFYLLGKECLKDDFDIKSKSNLEQLYKKTAIEVVTPLVKTWSEKMQLFPTHVGFRKAKTRWGSCSAKDRVSFSTNLAKMPIEFIEYVVVHELAHIKHKNHSREFWDEVEKFLPDYKNRKKLITDLTH